MTPRGLFQTLELGTASGRTILRAQLPRPLRGGLVVRLSLLRAGGLPLGTNAGLGAQPVSAGTLRLRGFRAGGRPVPTDFGSWTGGPGVRATGSSVRYLLTPDTGVATGVFRGGIYAGSNPAIYPANNYFPASMSAVGFMDLAGGNYRISALSPYIAAGTGGTTPGANLDMLGAAMTQMGAPICTFASRLITPIAVVTAQPNSGARRRSMSSAIFVCGL